MAEKKTDLGRNNQKMKPFFVYDFLMRNSNAENPVKTERILEYLEELGIGAERRSIYKDIEEINKALILTTRKDYDDIPKADTFEEAEELLKDEKEKTIVYDKNKKAFYVRKRNYSLEDVRTLAECVYSAKFLDEKRANRLVKVVGDLVCEIDAKGLERDVILLDRGKSNNLANYESLQKISFAMCQKRIKKVSHIPEKIKFKYLSYTIQNGLGRTERRKGE